MKGETKMELNTRESLTQIANPPVEPRCYRELPVEAAQAAELLRSIHRWDGHTVLCCKRARWQETGFQVEQLTASTLSQFVGTQDWYFTINTMASARRTSANTLYLTAVWVDIDGPDKKVRLKFDEIQQAITEHRTAGIVPPFSFLVDSGRGVWGVILLTAEHGGPSLQQRNREDSSRKSIVRSHRDWLDWVQILVCMTQPE
ncbi:MAG TPA: hypothetical protein VII23_14025 [Terriglobales bacterium]